MLCCICVVSSLDVNTGCSLYDNNRKINVQWYGADRLETFIRGI